MQQYLFVLDLVQLSNSLLDISLLSSHSDTLLSRITIRKIDSGRSFFSDLSDCSSSFADDVLVELLEDGNSLLVVVLKKLLDNSLEDLRYSFNFVLVSTNMDDITLLVLFREVERLKSTNKLYLKVK